jgi:hypothetical protein
MASNNSKNDLKIICKKKILEPNVVKNVSSTKKGSWIDTCVGLYIENHIFLTRPW